jgi:hypothetical protein
MQKDSLKMKLIFLISLLSSASAFSPTYSATSLRAKTPAALTSLNVASVPPPVTENPPKPAKIPEMIDENVYTFNKILIDTVYNIICFFYPVKGTSRDFARFYVLETVARVPYFAYLSVMHLRYVMKAINLDLLYLHQFIAETKKYIFCRETFGERDLGDSMRTHYAEADNELHHLLIMESLGGNENSVDRVLAQTMAFTYYWYVVAGKCSM